MSVPERPPVVDSAPTTLFQSFTAAALPSAARISRSWTRHCTGGDSFENGVLVKDHSWEVPVTEAGTR
jgi:hypothetical protein